MDRLPILVQGRGDVEVVRVHSDGDEEGCVGEYLPAQILQNRYS